MLWLSEGGDNDVEDDEMKGSDDDGDAVVRECDVICDALRLPPISAMLSECWKDAYFKNYLCALDGPFARRLAHSLYVDGLGAPRLISLPSDYNALFEMAAESKCERKGRLPAKSGLCLLCGQVLCIGCCRGSVVAHCRRCNDGIGAILFFQKSSVLLVWDGYCTEYPSLYLDRNGEPDTNLW